ncbi:MAG: protein kinase [Ignavibacteriaceae bacterium]
MINTRYEIIKKLGEGRSSVYLCRDVEYPGKEYAIKILPAGLSENEQASFYKEYFILRKLEHPFIIKPFGLGTVVHKEEEKDIEIDSPFITLEYFNGVELLKSEEINKESILKEIIKQICSVLYYLHQSKYIYYDLKPENILISFNSSNPEIRLIDLGLAEYSPSPLEYEIKGTAQYIAPELLKKENHNHSVDFYSLGIMLYRILYQHFPTDSENDLEIYKAAIENEINFPASEKFSPELIAVTKILTEKDTTKRYSSALAVIKDLGFQLDNSITKEFLPAKVFSSRSFAVNVLSKYISDKTSSEVFTVKGFDGVGKTALLNKMLETYSQAILISDIKLKSGSGLIRYILRKIIFSETVFTRLTEEDKKIFIELMNRTDEEIVKELRSAVILLSSKTKFILFIDDINLFDQLSMDLLLEIFPFFQVNNIKVIISESSEHDFVSNKINNVRDVTLGSFTDDEMKSFLQESYNDEKAINELQKLILSYADLIPGNIKSFIKDLILLGIMKFSESGILFSDEEDKLSALKEAHFAIYDLRLANLSQEELSAVKVLSAIDTYIDTNILNRLLDFTQDETERIINILQLHNIVQEYTSGQTIIFTSEAFKKHVYASIEDKKKLHFKIATKLSEKLPSFNKLELSRQYELAEEFESCFDILMKEVETSEKHFSLEYIRKILVHLEQLPLETKQMEAVKKKLSEIYFKLGDVQSALKTIKELKSTLNENELGRNLLLIEGNSLIDSGEIEAGKKVIRTLLQGTEEISERQKLKVELAYADYELKKYEEAIHQCDELLKENNLTAELKGRCYNLKGIIDSLKFNDQQSAIENFNFAKTEFLRARLLARVARAENNIGLIYLLLNDFEEAEEHWRNASKINTEIGDLEQEGILKNNLGDFYFSRAKFDLAIDSYLKAENIVLSLGNEIKYGIILKNLGIVYLRTCNYQEALGSLREAYKVFTKMNNTERVCEVLIFQGMLLFKVGYLQEMTKIINSIETIVNKSDLPSKYHTGLRYLKLLNQILKDGETQVENIHIVLDQFKNHEEKNFLIECWFIMIEQLIRDKNFNAANNTLMGKEILDLISQNSILEAEREYFLGIVARNYPTDNTPLEHFERAYELIKDENVIELTWKVLFAISELYIERGNLNKAKRYIVYAREIIYFLAERIESHRLRAAYLHQKERFSTLRKLENFYPSH